MSIILSLCDRTGNMVRPWAAAGWECWCVDIQHSGDTVRDGVRYIGADVLRFLPPKKLSAVFAFSPCTNLAVSGSRWFREKGLYGLSRGLDVAERCVAILRVERSALALGKPGRRSQHMVAQARLPVSAVALWRLGIEENLPMDGGGIRYAAV